MCSTKKLKVCAPLQKLSVGEKRGPRASFKLSRKLPFIKKKDVSTEEPEETKCKLQIFNHDGTPTWVLPFK